MLQAWTDGKRLLRGDHYFWILGGHVQKSIEGLLRAVLHALLSGLSQSGVSENLETIEHVCESRWQSTDKGRAWSSKELKDMLSRLAQTSNTKVFLLIGALDECDPQDRLGDLAEVILWLSRLPNFKLCGSCRPWAPFTRRFDKATILQLDQLTYRDMEMYIEKRLLCAENEADLCCEVRDGALPAKRLVYDVANAAKGVFLWVELVVNALCSEIRKGCSVDQLRLAISEFPTDLDDYFQKLIVGRIGTTRPNVLKTAAALKLAMVLRYHEVGHPNIPMSDDYLNFWLLSVGQLKSGFSWTDQLDPQYSAFDAEKKVRQTKAFLEETCKDLLVIQKHRHSYDVEFLHRTVFDFLCDNAASLHIEEHAPGHFSDEGFAMDLLKLRCICRLRDISGDCESSQDLLQRILYFLNGSALEIHQRCALEIHQRWLLACESTVLDTFRTRCNCLVLSHLGHTSFARHCASSGLHRYLLETAKDMPHGAFFRGDPIMLDHLWLALLELEKAGTRKATATSLLRQALGYGCDPNVSFYAACPDLYCRQSKWERWLRVQYLYSHNRVANGDRAHQSTGVTKDIDRHQTQENASIIELFLRHGADPNCTPCTTDHQLERTCSPTAFHDILHFLVPVDCFFRLATFLVACSSEGRRYTLRRNQRKRAIRSYIVSEQKFASRISELCPQELQEDERENWAESHWIEWRGLQSEFLKRLVILDDIEVECRTWKRDEEYICLFTWCVDCGSRSHACLDCRRPHHLTRGAPCTDFSKFRTTHPEGHTTITIFSTSVPSMCQGEKRWISLDNDLVSPSTGYQPLGCEPGELDLTQDAAISVLKKWYARNPIEPDSLQGDEFRDTALPEGLDVAALSIGGPKIDETSTSR
jgi:hypothetical protein